MAKLWRSTTSTPTPSSPCDIIAATIQAHKTTMQTTLKPPRTHAFDVLYPTQKWSSSGPPRVQERVSTAASTAKKKNVKTKGGGEHKALDTPRVTMQGDQKPGQLPEV